LRNDLVVGDPQSDQRKNTQLLVQQLSRFKGDAFVRFQKRIELLYEVGEELDEGFIKIPKQFFLLPLQIKSGDEESYLGYLLLLQILFHLQFKIPKLFEDVGILSEEEADIFLLDEVGLQQLVIYPRQFLVFIANFGIDGAYLLIGLLKDLINIPEGCFCLFQFSHLEINDSSKGQDKQQQHANGDGEIKQTLPLILDLFHDLTLN